MALREDGFVVTWGNSGPIPPNATNVVAIAAGATHCLALRDDGRVVWWNASTNTLLTLTNIARIAAGGSQTLALREDGAYYTSTGTNFFLPQSSNNVSLAAGTSHFLLLQQDGSVLGFGDNRYWQIRIPADVGPVTAVAAAHTHSVLFGTEISPPPLGCLQPI